MSQFTLLLAFALNFTGNATSVPLAAAVRQPPRATVQGRITVKQEPPRRVASRYAGAATPATQQQLPMIVYLRGAGLGSAQPPATAPVMAQHDTAFSPAYLVVAKGTSVHFRNEDPFYHNVFSYSKPKRFDLGRFPRPEAKAVAFDKTGTIDVFCEIHRSMRGVILVTDNAFHTEVAADGAYALRDVPAGSYELVVWNASHGEKVYPVTVPASGVVIINAAF